MKNLALIIACSLALTACKNNGQSSASTKKYEEKKPSIILKPIIVDATFQAPKKPPYRVLDWKNFGDTLRVIVNYSGGCEEHDFKAYFSGSWLKSMPPQAMIDLEHLDPNRDACRQLVTDTVYFDLNQVRYEGQKTVVVKWAKDGEKAVRYRY